MFGEYLRFTFMLVFYNSLFAILWVFTKDVQLVSFLQDTEFPLFRFTLLNSLAYAIPLWLVLDIDGNAIALGLISSVIIAFFLEIFLHAKL